MPLPHPILSMTIAPVDVTEGERLHAALSMICAADASLCFAADRGSNTAELRGESLEQLTAVIGRIEGEFKIPLDFGAVDVIRLETIRCGAEGEGKYVRQAGGSGNYGHVKLRLEPNTLGWGLQFASSLPGGVIPAEFLTPIEEGVREAARAGIVHGYELTDVRATLINGSHHEVDSNPMAFRIAASRAFQDAARKASPVLLEPVMSVTFSLPESNLRAALTEISTRRGQMTATSTVRGVSIVQASIPLAEMLREGGPVPTAMEFEGFQPISRGPDDADAAGSAVRNPRDPKPVTGSATANIDPDRT